jgi:CRP-like cAMP-binding protein
MADRSAQAPGDRRGHGRLRDHSRNQNRDSESAEIRAGIFAFVRHAYSARNARVEEDLVDQLFNSTEKRLARVLLLFANFGKQGRPEPIVANINQETLAEMIGTTRSRVSHFMNKFRKLGFIDYNGHLEVHSSLLSVVLADPSRAVNSNSKGSRE